MKLVGLDVGSTTVKAVVVEDGRTRWQDYQRHSTREAEKVMEFLGRMEADAGLEPGEALETRQTVVAPTGFEPVFQP